MHIKISEQIKKQIDAQPNIGVILGSGWSESLNNITPNKIIKYSSLKNMPQTTVKGHDGNFILATVGDNNVIFVEGRFHLYEGYDASTATLPIKILKELGVEQVIITNSSGGINHDFEVGDIVVIRDQINLSGQNPLIGLRATNAKPIFVDMTSPYDKEMSDIAKDIIHTQTGKNHSGTYLQLSGPNYETPAEIIMARNIGADMVGMSTAIETIMARYENMRVLGLSMITNKASGQNKTNLNHKDVLDEVVKNKEKLSRVLVDILKTI